MPFYKHEICTCSKYKPDFTIYQVKLDGKNYRCRACARFVSPLKWKGGFIERKNHIRKKGTIMVFVDKSRCPCCGDKMSMNRKAKKRLIQSVERQIKSTTNDDYNLKILPQKIKFIEEKLATPIVH